MCHDADLEVRLTGLYALFLLLAIGCPSTEDTADTDTDTDTDTEVGDTLAVQRLIWEASGIEDYAFVLQWACFCDAEMAGPALITVASGEVESATYTLDGQPVTKAFMGAYAFDGLFDFLQSAVDMPADSIEVSYDPSLGYPTNAYVDYYFGALDDEMGFTVSEYVAEGSL